MEIGTPIVKEVNGKIGLYLKTELEDGNECIDFFTLEQIKKIIKRLEKIK
jgi:hypothetical protein